MKTYLKLIFAAIVLYATQATAQTAGIQPMDTATVEKLTTLNAKDIALDRLMTIPGMGLFLNVGDGEYKSLDRSRCPDFERFMLLDNMWYDQLVATEDLFIVRNGSQVYAIDSTRCMHIADFDTPCFRLFAGNGDIFYMVVYKDSGSSIYSCSLDDGKATLLVTLPEDIICVRNADRGFVFIAGNTLYIADGTDLHKLLNTEEALTDMVVTRHGLLFCTASSLYLYDGEVVTPLANDKFFRLFYDRGLTYIVLADGTIYRSDIF